MRKLVFILSLLAFTVITLEGYTANSHPEYFMKVVDSYAREFKEALEKSLSFRRSAPEPLKSLALHAGSYAEAATRGAAKPGYYAYRFNLFSIILRSIEQYFGSRAELADNKLVKYTCTSIATPARLAADTISTLSAVMIYLGLPPVVIIGILYGIGSQTLEICKN